MTNPLEVPPYVAESLRAWCWWDLRHRKAAQRPDDQLAPDYDPESDWLDEPFPEEYD